MEDIANSNDAKKKSNTKPNRDGCSMYPYDWEEVPEWEDLRGELAGIYEVIDNTN